MNAERLLAHYERIADAPDAIARLRRFILDLAVRGKLVPQAAADVPASELLKRIAKEKARLVKAGKLKQQPEVALAAQDEPWSLPAHWAFVPLGFLAAASGLFTDGDWVESKDQDPSGDVRLTQLADVGLGEYRNRSSRFMNASTAARLNCTFLTPGDILIARMPDPLGRACIFSGDPKPCVTVVDVAVLRLGSRDFDATYVVHAINSPQFARNVESKAAGTTRSRISRGNLSQLPFPLPPLAEQHRIVAKVDELMALCERLEATRAEREATRDRLAAASLARLNAPDPDPAIFADHARFVLGNLTALTKRPEQVKQLRQAILNLAVRGKLVPQHPDDGTGREFLSLLKKARTVWEAAVRVRKQNGGQVVGEKEKYLETPQTWVWARLFEIGQTQTGTSPSSANPDLFGDFIPFVKPGDLDSYEINYDGPGLSETGVEHSRSASANSILMVCIGATLGKVNKTTRSVCFNQQINSLTPYLDGLTDYVAIALKASDFQELAWSKAGTGTLPIISKGKWEILPIPLPPLAEQRRIVAKVDELMALCDRLEASLTATDATRRRLLDALLAEALAPAEARGMEAAE